MSVAPAPTPGALRMRQSRERRRNGIQIIQIEVMDSGIDILSRKGYLRPEQRNDPEAIKHALREVLYWLFTDTEW